MCLTVFPLIAYSELTCICLFTTRKVYIPGMIKKHEFYKGLLEYFQVVITFMIGPISNLLCQRLQHRYLLQNGIIK